MPFHVRSPALVAAAIALSLGLVAPIAVAAPQPNLIEFYYGWGTSIIGGAQVWTWGDTNLTRNITVTNPNGSHAEEITEFMLYTRVPGKDAYPAMNGTNAFPYPEISAIYDTTYILSRPSDCIWVNDSRGLVCNVPRYDYQHQVLEIRFARLVEFTDSNGDGAYNPGEPVLSQVDLSSRGEHYSMPNVTGLDASGAAVALPVINNLSQPCCGGHFEGWVGEKDALFPTVRGLRTSFTATGLASLTVTAYEWFEARQFQGENLTASQVKLDLRIAGYPFASSNSRLALDVNLTSFSQGSATQWNMIPWPEGQGVGMNAGNTSAMFAWSGTAEADNVRASVASSQTVTDAFSRHVFLAYPRASVIEHDPVFGIVDNRIGGNNLGPSPFSLSLTWTAFVATLAAGAAVIYVIERRKR
jgi:hypothetical protein